MKSVGFEVEVNGARLSGHSWQPDATIAQLLVVHGLAEHSARYAGFAAAMNARGIGVTAVDARGHGHSAASVEALGHVADRGGWATMVDDVRGLVRHVRAVHPDTPLVLLGHSMGTLVVRELLSQQPVRVDAVVLSGPVGHPGLAKGRLGLRLAATIAKLRGPGHRSALLDQLVMGGNNASIKPARTRFDWLSTVADEVDAYVADELCGQRSSAAFVRDLVAATMRVNDPRICHATPRDVPMLVIAGDDDPIADGGEVPRRIAACYRAAGLRVQVRTWPGMRHELFNEAVRDEVFDQVSRFVLEVAGR